MYDWTMGLVRCAQDVREAISAKDIEERFDLGRIQKRQLLQVFPTSAETGDGLQEGFTWITDQINKRKK